MNIMLVAVAVISILVGQTETGLMVGALVLLNPVVATTGDAVNDAAGLKLPYLAWDRRWGRRARPLRRDRRHAAVETEVRRRRQPAAPQVSSMGELPGPIGISTGR